MHFFDADAIDRALSFPLLIDALADAHRRAPIMIDDTMMGDEHGSYFIRNAVDPGRFVGSKLITSTPGNPYRDPPLPAVQAVCVIFDAADGRPLAVLDGTILTQWRTAADSGLGARLLARDDARTLLIVGAGAMARPLARAHRTARPSIERILVWNRTADRAAEVVADLVAEGLPAEVATGPLGESVRVADVVSTCTRAVEPVVLGADLRPGTHVDLVGAFTHGTREIDDEAMARGRIFVDRREAAFDIGDILIPIANGAITADDVLGDLHDLVAGRVGRRSADDITIYENGGGGHLDLITAETILRASGVL